MGRRLSRAGSGASNRHANSHADLPPLSNSQQLKGTDDPAAVQYITDHHSHSHYSPGTSYSPKREPDQGTPQQKTIKSKRPPSGLRRINLTQFVQCQEHPKEKVRYYCRDDHLPLCAECVVSHARHDFVAADSKAAVEIRNNLKVTRNSLSERLEQYVQVLD